MFHISNALYDAPPAPLSESDQLADDQMRKHRSAQGTFPLFAEIRPLQQSSNVVWNGSRGWYDDILKVVDWRDKDDDDWWDPKDPGPENSYYGWDLDQWDDIQHEKGTSLTLHAGKEELATLDSSIGQLEFQWERVASDSR